VPGSPLLERSAGLSFCACSLPYLPSPCPLAEDDVSDSAVTLAIVDSVRKCHRASWLNRFISTGYGRQTGPGGNADPAIATAVSPPPIVVVDHCPLDVNAVRIPDLEFSQLSLVVLVPRIRLLGIRPRLLPGWGA
jgi:hypothetical protein